MEMFPANGSDVARYGSIEEFYSGRSVFITGGTGFLGKVLIEKLLYGCPNLRNVYILVRNKKNVSSKDRLKKLLEYELFSRLKKEKPESLKKIVPIIGDVALSNLGLSKEDTTELLDKVSVVFHLAATIRFNEPLSEAMRINVEGTRTVVKFSQQIKELHAFLYMSTAFANTDQWIQEEIIYPPPMTIEDVYEFLKVYGDDESRVREIINPRPNTYTFTKAISESLVAEIHGDMPTVIVRPSVVVAAMHEPIRGWIDTWIGPTPILDAIGRGWLQCLYGKQDYAFDIIPVDYVVNATIVAAAKCQRSKKPTVYNCCTSTINKLSLKQVYILYRQQSLSIGYNDLPLKLMIFTKSWLILSLITLLFQIIPAYILDLIRIIKRKPTKYVKLQHRMASYLNIIKFFSSRSWMMMSTRVRDLADDLSPADLQKFPCNPAQIDWNKFIPAYFDGVVTFLVPKTPGVL